MLLRRDTAVESRTPESIPAEGGEPGDGTNSEADPAEDGAPPGRQGEGRDTAQPGEGLVCRTVVLGRDVSSPDGRCPELIGIGADGALLVRSDGHIAWHSTRGSTPASALADLLREAERPAR